MPIMDLCAYGKAITDEHRTTWNGTTLEGNGRLFGYVAGHDPATFTLRKPQDLKLYICVDSNWASKKETKCDRICPHSSTQPLARRRHSMLQHLHVPQRSSSCIEVIPCAKTELVI
jgi:hypothetical protein